jgi:hypothetical protein
MPLSPALQFGVTRRNLVLASGIEPSTTQCVAVRALQSELGTHISANRAWHGTNA